MDVKKKILLFLLIGGVTVIQAQKNEKFTPPNMTQKTHTFALPELQIDSTFITNLNTEYTAEGGIISSRGESAFSGEFAKAGLDKKVWQYFTVVPDFKSVGVRDNARCFEYPVIIRAVNTIDAMSASIEQIDWPVLLKITDRILKEVKNVNRVCYDLSPKPTATIEWE